MAFDTQSDLSAQMPFSVPRWLRSIVPHLEEEAAQSNVVKTLRATLVVLIAGIPAFGVVYHLEVPELYDPAWLRAGVVAVAVALLVASYRIDALEAWARPGLVAITHVVMAWFFVLLVANDLDPNYALGFLFVVLASTLVYSLAWDRPGPMTVTLGVAAVYGLVAILATDSDGGSLGPLVFMTTTGSGAIVVFLAFYGRLRTAAELDESQRALSQAEVLAQTGAWTRHLRTGNERWSDGTYRILGVTQQKSGAPCFEGFIHPDDLDLCAAERDRLLATGETSDFRYRTIRANGSVRWIRAVSKLVLDASGRPVETRGVIADITDQVAREADLERARDIAEAATRSQSEFLANMSHEIRTPLTAIIGFAQMLREEVPDADAGLVVPIETGGKRLLGTLNSVLDLARLEAGQAELEVAPADLGLEAEEVAGLFRLQAQEQGLAFDLEVEDAPLEALAATDAFGRVLSNLLSNALKFTEEGGIRVSVRSAGRTIEVAVSDTGCGMSPEFLEDLFEPFRQASTGWARSHEGTGLGMSITHRLVLAMGGTIEVESASGLGSTFTVALPAAPPPVVTPAPRTGRAVANA